MKTVIQIAMLSVTILLSGCLHSETPVLSLNVGRAPDLSGTYVRDNAFGKGTYYKKTPSVKIGKYANDAVFRGEFRWHIILNADNTFTLATENFEGAATMTGTWTSDSSGNVTAKIAKGKSLVFTGGGTDVLTLTVWPYGNAFNNTPLYYDASQAAAPAKSAASDAAGKKTASDAPAKSPAPTTPAATPAPGSPNTPTASVQPAPSPIPPVYPPLVPDKNGKPQIAAHPLRFANGIMEIALQVLAPGKTVAAVRIDNVGGVASAWRSDGKDSAKPLTVMDGGVLLADGKAAMSLALGNAEKLLTVSFADNGAVAGGVTDLRITVFFTDKSRAMCLLDNIKEFLSASERKR